MKRRSLFLVAFLMCLYITPSLFMASYAGVDIAVPQNTSKEFVVADSWVETGNVSVGFDTPEWIEAGNVSVGFDTFPYGSNPSNQSIEGFSETLDDDVLSYPDSFLYDREVVAYEGSAGYTDTHVKDSVDFTTGPWNELNFTISGNESIDYFGYHFYVSSATSVSVDLYAYNWTGDTIDIIENNVGDVGWHNNTCYLEDYYSDTGKIILRVYTGMDNADIDYFSLDYFVMTLANENNYAESFADVSDGTAVSQEGNDAFSSDGDIMDFTVEYDAGDPYDRILFETGSAIPTNSYIEMFYYVNSTAYNIYIELFDGAGGTGDKVQQEFLKTQTSWDSGKYYIGALSGIDSLDAIRSYRIQVRALTDETIHFYSDRLRIASADEFGWSHDGSTTAGWNTDREKEAGDTWVSDGSSIVFKGAWDSGATDWDGTYTLLDDTATSLYLDTSYYPFFEAYVRLNNTDVNTARFYVTDTKTAYGTTLALAIDTTTTDWQYVRANVKSTLTKVGYLLVQFGFSSGQNAKLEIAYTSFYSIANYTISQSSTTVNDYLYVSEGVLYSNIDSGNIVLDYDPSLNIERPYYGWGLNSSLGQPQVDFYNASDGWLGYSSESEGQLPYNSNIIDVRFRFSDIGNITSLTFFDSSGWRDTGLAVVLFRIKSWISITIAIIRFFIEAFSRFSFTAFFTLAGLIMIPVSTILLVKGGRSDMSRDKLFLFLMIFLFGWAFFLGGIL